MANYYRILSAFSASGDDLFIPVPWNFDDISDISVVVAGTNGSPSICNYWKWNSQLHQVEIEKYPEFFSMVRIRIQKRRCFHSIAARRRICR